MGTRVSTKHKLISQLESADSILRDVLNAVSKRPTALNLEPLVELLLEVDQQLKATLDEVETQNELQKKIDTLRADCAKSDKQISACQIQLRKAESTALYYSRQKLGTMATAVKNPVEVDELIRFSHRISATHGVNAPENWVQGDPRRPYPNREEIRRGYLGHLDDNGQFRASLWDALAETSALVATSSHATPSGGVSTTSTPGGNPVANLSHLSNQTVNTSAHHGTESLGLSGSPNMILPGVNMVSSPVAVPQPNPSTWTGSGNAQASGTPSSAELSSPQASSNRQSTSSLSTMLSASGVGDPHPRVGPGLAPPPLPLRTIASQPVLGGTASSRGTVSMGKVPGVGHRSAFALSPGMSLPQQPMHVPPQSQPCSEPHSSSTASPKIYATQRKQTKCKSHHPEDVGTMSSDTSSDSSSIDD
ncbi:Mediator of RNA polymerase II transcription subunit 4 [Fasciolopsis buskii]|uniref:Mediator of RNA polymerase II transcription subunit 4 n=1 Tax=Fasciolopsis buskii TaxID=27845 RepID=A0A8E0RSJ8_9TREM|nr:Mediator of RNA polymerase II transcription subunit 4 [Fasciolopsis buski]